ncbi:MAG: nucleotide exchange factor GrpE [Myxococcales bacterium]
MSTETVDEKSQSVPPEKRAEESADKPGSNGSSAPPGDANESHPKTADDAADGEQEPVKVGGAVAVSESDTASDSSPESESLSESESESDAASVSGSEADAASNSDSEATDGAPVIVDEDDEAAEAIEDEEQESGPGESEVLREQLATAGKELDEACARLDAARLELSGLKKERDKMRQQLMRTAADFDNFRKRTKRDLQTARNRGRDDLVRDVLPIFDNLERAVDASEKATDVASVVEGVRMVLKLFNDTTARMGLSRIPTVGEHFDPAVHEALQQQESHEHEPGTVMSEIMPGYTFDERLIRAAMVVVAKAPSKPKDEPKDEQTESKSETASELDSDSETAAASEAETESESEAASESESEAESEAEAETETESGSEAESESESEAESEAESGSEAESATDSASDVDTADDASAAGEQQGASDDGESEAEATEKKTESTE